VWAWILKIPTWDFALLLIVISLVLCAELLNTAIEAVIDLVSPEWHPLAKVAKDTAAGAVLVSAVFAVAVGLVILYKPMMIWLGLN
jgi:undecaprenol kinase